jgi:hypothetical protein
MDGMEVVAGVVDVPTDMVAAPQFTQCVDFFWVAVFPTLADSPLGYHQADGLLDSPPLALREDFEVHPQVALPHTVPHQQCLQAALRLLAALEFHQAKPTQMSSSNHIQIL